MLTVPRTIDRDGLNKLYLRASRSPVIAEFTLQGFSYGSNAVTELLVPNNEVLLLPAGAGCNVRIQGTKYDFRADASPSRYNASFAAAARTDGTVIMSDLNSEVTPFTVGFTSTPSGANIGVHAQALPNVPNQQYLRFVARGVSGVDIQFVLQVYIVSTQPLLG